MNALVFPYTAKGSVTAPSSKSELHRLLIASALSENCTEIHCLETNDDIDATVRCLKSLGAGITKTESGFSVVPVSKSGFHLSSVLDCGESGSTLRFMLPIAAAIGGSSFTGSGRLPERPIIHLIETLKAHGAIFSAEKLPFKVSGILSGGEYCIPGNVSSQYITGLMLAAPLIGKTVINVEGGLQSADYIQITADVMSRFGITVSISENIDKITINGNQKYKSPGIIESNGDWSASAFPMCLGALGGPVAVQGLSENTKQGDRRIIDVLRKAGADVRIENKKCIVKRKNLSGLTIDVSDIPDLVPAMAALFMHAEGRTVFTNAERLCLKESDRLSSTCNMVNALGGQAMITGHSLCIDGSSDCTGGIVDGSGDHRIVMAAVIAASACKRQSTIIGVEAVSKSWPEFFDEMKTIGGKFDVVNVR